MGFDESDIIETPEFTSEKLTFVHIGTLGEARNPLAFWQALGELVKRTTICLRQSFSQVGRQCRLFGT